jgi:hypothetical protein
VMCQTLLCAPRLLQPMIKPERRPTQVPVRRDEREIAYGPDRGFLLVFDRQTQISVLRCQARPGVNRAGPGPASVICIRGWRR